MALLVPGRPLLVAIVMATIPFAIASTRTILALALAGIRLAVRTAIIAARASIHSTFAPAMAAEIPTRTIPAAIVPRRLVATGTVVTGQQQRLTLSAVVRDASGLPRLSRRCPLRSGSGCLLRFARRRSEAAAKPRRSPTPRPRKRSRDRAGTYHPSIVLPRSTSTRSRLPSILMPSAFLYASFMSFVCSYSTKP